MKLSEYWIQTWIQNVKVLGFQLQPQQHSSHKGALSTDVLQQSFTEAAQLIPLSGQQRMRNSERARTLMFRGLQGANLWTQGWKLQNSLLLFVKWNLLLVCQVSRSELGSVWNIMGKNIVSPACRVHVNKACTCKLETFYTV